MLICVSSSMKTFALSMTNIFSLYLFVFTLDFMRIAAIKTAISSSYSSHKSRAKNRTAFDFSNTCYAFVISYDIRDTCQKFSKRSGVLEYILHLRTNRQELQKMGSGKKRLIYSEKICLHKYRCSSRCRWNWHTKKKFHCSYFVSKVNIPIVAAMLFQYVLQKRHFAITFISPCYPILSLLACQLP